jgi:hypothetical protein
MYPLVLFQPQANCPWKHHSTLVIPSAAQRSRGTCGAPFPQTTAYSSFNYYLLPHGSATL